MYAAVHPWAVINGGINQAVFGDAAVRHGAAAHDSEQRHHVGIRQRRQPGQSDPAVHDALVGRHRQDGRRHAGRFASRNTIGREDALIAHTRRNAFFLFQEDNLGSIQPGKLADLVVLDRDYLTVPADQIKDIKSVMTMVGGRVVYDASDGTRRPSRRPQAK